MTMADNISDRFPIHWLVWEDRPAKLKELLVKDKTGIDRLDLQGRSPLHLAILLRNLKCIDILLEFNASTSVQSTLGWSVIKEAISSGDDDIAKLCMRYEYNEFDHGVPAPMQTCLDAIEQEPDIYFEIYSHMKVFFFNVWSSRLKVWKKGAYYRADVEDYTFITKINGDTAFWTSLDHKKREYQSEETKCPSPPPERELKEEAFAEAMKKPVQTHRVNVEALLRDGLRKTGEEIINGYDCSIYKVPTIEASLLERSDHLLGKQPKPIVNNVKAEQYFTTPGMDIQPPMNVTNKNAFTYKREAKLWICEDHPISMKGHLMPILDMLSYYYDAAKGIRQFFIEHVPSGCPVRATVEIDKSVISWFPVETTLENVFGSSSPVQGVTLMNKNGKESCIIDDSVFNLPTDYKKVETKAYTAAGNWGKS